MSKKPEKDKLACDIVLAGTGVYQLKSSRLAKECEYTCQPDVYLLNRPTESNECKQKFMHD